MFADMHCDTISAMMKRKRAGENISLSSNSLHIDIEKLKNSDCLLQNFALFVKLSTTEDALDEVLEMTDLYYEELTKNKDFIAPVFCYEDIEKNHNDNKISALLTVEEGGVCKGSLSHLRNLYRLGVRMMTLTWNFPNELGHPNLNASLINVESYTLNDVTTPNTQNGLTPTGISFLEEMERLGMIIDVSHLSDAGFYDVFNHTKKPFVASHSNARSICSWARNLTDDMIQKIAVRGGVIGLNFLPDFLTEVACLGQENPGTIESIISHAKHIVKIGGIDCLALGSDFDGIDGHKELSDASCIPLLQKAFLNSGFTQTETDKIMYQNVLRVYKECLK